VNFKPQDSPTKIIV